MIGRAAFISLFLHAMLLASLLRWLDQVRPPPEAPDTPPMIELVLEEQKGSGATTAPPVPIATQPAPVAQPAAPALQTAERKGRAAAPPEPERPGNSEPSAPPPPQPSPTAEPLPAPPVASPAQALTSRPAPPAEAGSVARRAEPPPPAPAPAPVAAPGPEQHLGGTDSLTNASASGPDVIPAKVDAQWRNREPVYPPAAAMRGEHGTVLLLVHVAADGLAARVDVARSSGFMLLDRSAREAIGTWHFLPAVRDGQPVPFDVPLRVVFRLN